MKVLVACEESQRVCCAFRELGHEAYSCDIMEPSGGHPEWHILGDAISAVQGGQVSTMDGKVHDIGKWDLLIAHPPCTYLTNAGARHLFKGGKLNLERYYKGMVGKALFMAFVNADVDKIVIENPVPSKIFNLPKYSQVIQPYFFGDAAVKKTCLWLKNLPLLERTSDMEKPEYRTIVQKNGKVRKSCWEMDVKRDRARERSKTFPGIAKAIAMQYGGDIRNCSCNSSEAVVE